MLANDISDYPIHCGCRVKCCDHDMGTLGIILCDACKLYPAMTVMVSSTFPLCLLSTIAVTELSLPW